ncbi:FAD-dependent oxidoreductase [Streptomyces sp. NPDC057638]|uniref:FAD-dependent oxidoreductase n=1 Tax=Streptomyces sp. NPDC057638 TaxID=3346190 RepID=UPI0036B77F10
MPRKRTIVIAGGGIAGLACAAALATRGTDVTVIERAGQIGATGSGLVLYPNGIRAATALTATTGPRLRTLGRPTRPGDTRTLMDADGTIHAEEPLTPVGSQIPLLRTALHRTLLDEALTAGAAVRLATTVTHYTNHPTHITAHLADTTTLTCDALIGADGIHSAIRAHMLHDGPPRYRGYTSVRGRTTGSRLGQRAYVVNGRGIQLFIAPVGHDTLYWTAKITAPQGHWPALGPAGAHRALLDALASWHPPITHLIRTADPHDIVVTDIHDRDPAPRWTDGRAALTGDAAHPMVPALGQGANMALEDAAVLAAVLAAPLPVPDALAAYARQRMDRTAATVLASRAQGTLDQGADDATADARTTHINTTGRKDSTPHHLHTWHPPTTVTSTSNPVPAVPVPAGARPAPRTHRPLTAPRP